MVQVSFDTNNDSLEELEHALNMLQAAIGKKRGVVTNAPAEPVRTPKLDMATVETPEEETILDTPFLKIKAKSEEHEEPKSAAPAGPTLNQLLEEASLSDEDFAKMLKEQLASEPAKPRKETKQDDDGYIEIVEYAEEK